MRDNEKRFVQMASDDVELLEEADRHGELRDMALAKYGEVESFDTYYRACLEVFSELYGPINFDSKLVLKVTRAVRCFLCMEPFRA
jgi:hypothetical protein